MQLEAAKTEKTQTQESIDAQNKRIEEVIMPQLTGQTSALLMQWKARRLDRSVHELLNRIRGVCNNAG